jgi:hypothetical protein
MTSFTNEVMPDVRASLPQPGIGLLRHFSTGKLHCQVGHFQLGKT